MLLHRFCVRCIPFILSGTAFFLSATTSTSCRFLLVETKTLSTFVGVLRFAEASSNGDGVCRDIRFLTIGESDDLADPNEDILKIAKIAGVVAPLMGGIATLLFLFSFFCSSSTKRELWTNGANLCLTLATLGQLGTFFLFSMSYCKGNFSASAGILCSTAEGAFTSIAAIVFYIAAAVTCCIIPILPMPLVAFIYDEISGETEEISLTRILTVKDEEHRDETEVTHNWVIEAQGG